MSIVKKIFKKKDEIKNADVVKPEAAVEIEKKEAIPAPVKKEAQVKKVSSAKSAVASKGKSTKKEDPRAYRILHSPLITEKATDLASLNKYVFVVPVEANKSEIIKTVTNVYGIKPVKVNIIKKKGKKVRYGRRYGKTIDFKKAVISFASGDKIEVYEGV